MGSLYSNHHTIYCLLCISFLYNISHSACNKATDALTHKVCYPTTTMDTTTMAINYNKTIHLFTYISDYNFIFAEIQCESETDTSTPEIPSSILTNHHCFHCCSATISSNVNSIEYTNWALLYNINENILEFAIDLETHSAPATPTYIFYASASSNFISASCSSFPRICNYPLLTDFTLTLTLDTINDEVSFEFSKTNPTNWFGIGIGPMDEKGDAIIASDPSPSPTNVAEWILDNHMNPSPSPTSVYADPVQNLLTASFVPPTVTCTRSYQLNQNGTITSQFNDTTDSIIIYAAYGDGTDVAAGHSSVRISPVNVLITPNNHHIYWCSAVIDCSNTLNTINNNDCCILLPTESPTNDPTINPTYHPTQIPTSPSTHPTFYPTNNPITNAPTNNPTIYPTNIPTNNPTYIPTYNPTYNPTYIPTYHPTYIPTYIPTFNPINDPTVQPTNNPTTHPTYYPTKTPTNDGQANEPTSSPGGVAKDDGGGEGNEKGWLLWLIIAVSILLCCGCVLILFILHKRNKDRKLKNNESENKSLAEIVATKTLEMPVTNTKTQHVNRNAEHNSESDTVGLYGDKNKTNDDFKGDDDDNRKLSRQSNNSDDLVLNEGGNILPQISAEGGHKYGDPCVTKGHTTKGGISPVGVNALSSSDVSDKLYEDDGEPRKSDSDSDGDDGGLYDKPDKGGKRKQTKGMSDEFDD